MKKLLITFLISIMVVASFTVSVFALGAIFQNAPAAQAELVTVSTNIFDFGFGWTLHTEILRDTEDNSFYSRAYAEYTGVLSTIVRTRTNLDGYNYAYDYNITYCPDDIKPYFMLTSNYISYASVSWGFQFQGVSYAYNKFDIVQLGENDYVRLRQPDIIFDGDKYELSFCRKFNPSSSEYNADYLGITRFSNNSIPSDYTITIRSPYFAWAYPKSLTGYETGKWVDVDNISTAYIYYEGSLGVYLLSPDIVSDYKIYTSGGSLVTSGSGILSFYITVEVYNPSTNYVYYRKDNFYTVTVTNYVNGYALSGMPPFGCTSFKPYHIYGYHVLAQDLLVYCHGVVDQESIDDKYAIRYRLNNIFTNDGNLRLEERDYSESEYSLLPRLAEDEDVEGELVGFIPAIFGAFTDFFINTFSQMSIFGVTMLSIFITIAGVGLVIVIVKMLRR
jgi:hypothetical protein